MLINNFYNEDNQITTQLSGGRRHYSYRKPFIALDGLYYELAYGENPYSVAQAIFKSDKYAFLLSDANRLKDMFTWGVGDTFRIPERVVDATYKDVTIW